jgi:hypothetical protein
MVPIHDQRLRLRRQHRAGHGAFLATAFFAHRITGADRAVGAEAQNALQVRVGLDDIDRRFVGGVDLVGARETVVAELKPDAGVLQRGCVLSAVAADGGKLTLTTAGSEATAFGVLLEPSIDTAAVFKRNGHG